jgi:PAS domain S-box-containing protein
VSSSPKRGFKETPQKELSPRTDCWEYLACAKVLCPAYGKKGYSCWLIPRTHCGNCVGDDFFQKLAACLICPFFKMKGEEEAGGWNSFMTEQLRRYNAKVMEQIYQKEESFLEILNRIPDGLFTTDQEFRITYFNSAAEKITGFTAYDAVGMYCKDVFKNRICEIDCALKQAIKNRTNIYNREYSIINIEGRKIPIICSTTVFRDHEGRLTGGIEIFKDITELKNLQEEIVRREKKYRRIFEGSHDMIYITNLEGAILDVNQAGVEMLGYSNKRELLSVGTVKRLYNKAEDRNRFLKEISREGSVRDFEVDFKKRDGTPVHVLISSRQYRNPESGVVEFEGIIKDITQRKLAEEATIQRNVELSVLNATAMALNRSLNLNLVFKEALKNLIKVLGLSRGGVFLIDLEKKRAELNVRQGLLPMGKTEQKGLHFKDSLLEKYLLEKNGSFFPKPIFPPFQVTYESKKEKTVPWLSCFLITSKGKGLGFFGLDIPPERILSPHETHLIGSLANFLGGGIENAKLIKTIRRHRQELRRLTEKLFQTQEEERRRIARELHDEAGQALTAVKLGLDRLEEALPVEDQTLKGQVEEIRQMLLRTSSEIRRLSYRLHPTLLSDLGLEPALDLYLKGVTAHSKLKIDFRMVGFDHRLDPNMETVLYRFTQETLNNAIKHSQAEHFRLSIIKSYPKIIFLAEDDGIGFDGQIVGSGKRSLGLLGIRERTSLLEGTFQLKSHRGEGTKIRIEIPLKEPQEYGTTH